MRGLQATISRLTALRRGAAQGADGDGRLSELAAFAPNPGNLRALVYRPDGLAPGAPLVVVLHGCTQTAGGYDRGSGWSELADRHGFTLLYPEQTRANNPNLCFNWFVPSDARRGRGEARSIRAMIASLGETHAIDPSRVFVTGLSAGGAMTAVMLASYPDVFAGGAVIAGLPFATANTLPEALERMRGGGGMSTAQLSAIAAAGAPVRGRPPILSVWHGSADHVVAPSNADAIVAQWRGLHRAGEAPARTEMVDGHRRRTWSDAAGRAVIEQYDIAGMGHGVPLSTGGANGVGEAGAHMFETSISSTRHIARFWGLLGNVAADAKPRIEPVRLVEEPVAATPTGVTAVIENALRSAGLMR